MKKSKDKKLLIPAVIFIRNRNCLLDDFFK